MSSHGLSGSQALASAPQDLQADDDGGVSHAVPWLRSVSQVTCALSALPRPPSGTAAGQEIGGWSCRRFSGRDSSLPCLLIGGTTRTHHPFQRKDYVSNVVYEGYFFSKAVVQRSGRQESFVLSQPKGQLRCIDRRDIHRCSRTPPWKQGQNASTSSS